MHVCPNCGSTQIQLIREQSGGNISLGGSLAGAFVGEIILGDTGAIIGSIIGAKAFSTPIQSIELNYCLNCGNKWNAEVVFQLVMLVSELTRIELDLSIELDRYCLSDFVATIVPKIHRLETEKNNRPLVVASASKNIEYSCVKSKKYILSLGQLSWLICCCNFTIGFALFSKGDILVSIIPFLISFLFGYIGTKLIRSYDKEYRKYICSKEEEVAIVVIQRIEMAKEQLHDSICDFESKYYHLLMVCDPQH